MKPVLAPQDRLVSIDELDRDIVNLSYRINAATFELLVLITEFDERPAGCSGVLGIAPSGCTGAVT
jgi:hypothetical protein